MTLETYLKLEETEEARRMFYAGEMTEIPGSRPAHAFMVVRLGTAFMNAVEGSGARVTMVNLQLRTG